MRGGKPGTVHPARWVGKHPLLPRSALAEVCLFTASDAAEQLLDFPQCSVASKKFVGLRLLV